VSNTVSKKVSDVEYTLSHNKTVTATASTVGIGMISSIIFSIIDSIFFFYIEEYLQAYWKERNIAENVIPIINGGISSAISILIASYIDSYLETQFDIFKHPLIDATGIIIGTILILLVYKWIIMENKPIIHSFIKKDEYEKYV
jgi:hypothetical protein